MKGTIERFNELKNKEPESGYFYAPYIPKLITSLVDTENGNTRYNLVDKDMMDIKFVINNINVVRGNTSGKGRNDLVTIRCPRSGQIHELEFFAWSEEDDEDDGGCYFMTTKCLHESPAEEYLRIEEPNKQRALFNSREEVIKVLSSGKFWIDAKTNG